MPLPYSWIVKTLLLLFIFCQVASTGCTSTVTGAQTDIDIETIHEEPKQTASDTLIIRIHLPDGTIKKPGAANSSDKKGKP